MANLKNTSINDSGFFKLPVGDTAARPGSPNARQIRFNTETGKLEQFRPRVGAWIAPNNTGVIATGGDSVYDVDVEGTTYRVHVFTATGTSTFSVLQGGEVEYLIVAGGGSGGGGTCSRRSGGGGGAGGILTGKKILVEQGYTIEVGSGGSATISGRGSFGQNSIAFNETALGGGGGGGYNIPPLSGGASGGGGGLSADTTFNAGASGTPPQGNDGGDAAGTSAGRGAGGGGGAGSLGEDASGTVGGDGGIGLISFVSGAPVFYAGGGGGAGSTVGTGGFGGGSAGSRADLPDGEDAEDAVPNTGGGGGGNGNQNCSSPEPNPFSGAGGSGIVIIRYPLRQENPVTAPGRDVGDGLVLDLDFAKPTVYAGSGSTVSDSRLNGIEGDLVNGPVFVNPRTHRSAFDLDENNADIRFPNQYMSTQNATNVSYWFWIYNNWSAKTGYKTVFGIQQSSFDRVATLVLNTGDNGIIGFDLRNAGTQNRDVVKTDLRSFSNQWLNVAYTFDAGNHALYLNGSLETTDTASLTSFPSWVQGGGGGFALGDNASSSRQHGGVFAVTKIFTKTLSAQEINQQYQATRWRFGV